MRLETFSLLLVSSIVLASCASTNTPDIPVVDAPPVISPPDARPVDLKPIKFIVINNENRQKLDTEPSWYAFTPQNYENLSFNVQEMLRYIREQKSVISYYEGITSSK